MAYLVIALGALLSVGGGLSVFYGAGIVEVERGWTGVIAGATSLTGGVVTIALGLILKTLLDLRAAGARNIPLAAPAAAVVASVPLAAPASQAAEPNLEEGLLAAFLAPPMEPVAVAPARPEPVELPPAVPHSTVTQSERVVAAPIVPAAASLEAAASAVPVEEGLEPAGEPVPAKSRFRISFKPPAAEPPAPEPPAPEPQPIAAAEPPAPAMDDWLDRAFSSLDSELANHGEPARPPEVVPAPEAHAGAALDAFGHGVAELEPPRRADADRHEPAPAPSAQPAPQPAAAPSAVIGRYEADGTSYVMFADGSIEAQSEAGVYRFNSMTELKTFIEGAD